MPKHFKIVFFIKERIGGFEKVIFFCLRQFWGDYFDPFEPLISQFISERDLLFLLSFLSECIELNFVDGLFKGFGKL
jgi:hypothetical protein